MHNDRSFAQLSDRDLLAEVKRLSHQERRATARLVASLVELDARRLYLGEGCSSLFTYCTQVLHLSEDAAYGRIAAARAARRFPVILDLLEDGSVTLSAVCLLAPHLAEDNHRQVRDAARHRSKRDVERQVAALHPRPDVSSSMGKLPAATAVTTVASPAVEAHSDRVPTTDSLLVRSATNAEVVPPPAREVPQQTPRNRCATVRPTAPARYQIQFTIDEATHDRLRRVQDLLRHAMPNGDLAAVFDRALTALLDDLERTKLAAARRPRVSRAATDSRHIPSAVKRAVWARDGGRCKFVGREGRCTETGLLEFHHVVPYAVGGRADVEGIELRCRSHNQYEAELWFGPEQPWLVRERMAAREHGTGPGASSQ